MAYVIASEGSAGPGVLRPLRAGLREDHLPPGAPPGSSYHGVHNRLADRSPRATPVRARSVSDTSGRLQPKWRKCARQIRHGELRDRLEAGQALPHRAPPNRSGWPDARRVRRSPRRSSAAGRRVAQSEHGRSLQSPNARYLELRYPAAWFCIARPTRTAEPGRAPQDIAGGPAGAAGTAQPAASLMTFVSRAAAGTIASSGNPLKPSMSPEQARAFLYMGRIALTRTPH